MSGSPEPRRAERRRPDDRGQDRHDERAGGSRVASPVTERERAARRAAIASGTAAAGAPRVSSRRPPTARRRRPASRFDGGPRWRLLLIPVLVILTVVVIFQATSTPADTAQPADPPVGPTPAATPTQARVAAAAPGTTAPTSEAASADPAAPPGAVPDLTIRDAQGHQAASIAAAALPAGPEFVPAGAGTWHVVPGTTPTLGTGQEAHTYSIEVEDGLQPTEQDVAFATAVDAILADPRSWIGGGQVSLTRIDTGDPDFRISLTSQMTVRAPDQCGWEIPLEASCFNGYTGRVFINDARWVRGAMSYGGDIESYRSYAVNHEVGHALGMRHEPCPGAGQPAPVMMQQSWSTSNDDLSVLDPQLIPRDGSVCAPNPYPFPGAQLVAPASPAPTAAAG